MGNVISSELYNIKKNLTFKVVAVIFLVFVLISWCSNPVIDWLNSRPDIEEHLDKTLGVFSFAGFADGIMFTLPLAAIVGNLIAGEYIQGIVKQLVSTGTPRWKVLAGQFYALTVAVSLLTIVIAVVKAAGMGIMNGWGLEETTPVRLGLTVLGIIGNVALYTSIALLIAHMTKSAVVAIIINMMVYMAGLIAVGTLASILNMEWIRECWFTSVSANAVSLDISATRQLIAIATDFGLAILFTAAAGQIYSRRDI